MRPFEHETLCKILVGCDVIVSYHGLYLIAINGMNSF